jgi:molybdenum cofactor cytidylyltransferase
MIAGVVVAAGSSSRLGRPKQLLSLGGKPLPAWVLDALREAGLSPLVLVLGHGAEVVRDTLNLDDITVVVNTDYAEGMSTSLRLGLASLGPEVAGAVVAMADQPFISPTLITELVAEHGRTKQPLVAADFGDYQGPPILLGRAVWPLADEIRGDQGARFLLKNRPDWVATVPVPNRAAALDVDTEEAYAEAMEIWKRMGGDSGT